MKKKDGHKLTERVHCEMHPNRTEKEREREREREREMLSLNEPKDEMANGFTLLPNYSNCFLWKLN